ncbi:cytochrome P450 [Nonomuraea turkmeniaca]|uniref:Cytochrome P450 n=1 Tax=Nonomuraea turkmeniaca TaxID=103838 RepID=A0A5S4G0T0_9ACTN|nr:cytochrome P450 [Nonomuraea turkmeniaca]TMR18286.1 cytochrome P450 [Nonomuraea turkmeniaca]
MTTHPLMPAYLLLGGRAVERAFDQAGEVITTWLPGVGEVALLRDPVLIRQVMRSSGEVIDAASANRVQEPVIGRRGLAVLPDADHRRLRSVMQPALRGPALQNLRESTARIARQTVLACPAATPFELLPRLRVAMLRAILEVALGIDDPHRLRQWSTPLRRLLNRADSYEITVRYALRHVGALEAWPSYRRLNAACDRLIHAEVDRRRRRGEDRDDVLGVLMRACDERGARLTRQALRDELMSVIAGARTTTATGLAWVFERLARHPEVLRRLTAEADAADGESYAAAVVYEALRVRPPVTFIGRRTLRPYRLGPRTLRPGTVIAVHLMALHHNPGLYPDPAAFRPERWLGKRPSGYGWMPFGGGTHTCIGDHLAMMQIRTFLHVFARHAELRTADARDEPVRWRAISNTPGRGCRLILWPRDQ